MSDKKKPAPAKPEPTADEVRAAADMKLPGPEQAEQTERPPATQQTDTTPFRPRCECGADPIDFVPVHYQLPAPNRMIETWRILCCKNCRRPFFGMITKIDQPRVIGARGSSYN